MKMMKWKIVLLCGMGVCCFLAVHVAYVSRPRVQFSAMFSSGETLEIAWKPNQSPIGRLAGRGILVCTVADAKPIALVYGESSAYGTTRFVKQDAVAWDEKEENRIPAFTITETVRGAQWVIDHKGRFLGSN